MDEWFSFETSGALLLTAVWVFSIVRLWWRRRWSPLRPVAMAVVIAASLALMADAFATWAEGAALPSLFWIAAFNLWMAVFDLRLGLALGRQGRLTVTPRERMIAEAST